MASYPMADAISVACLGTMGNSGLSRLLHGLVTLGALRGESVSSERGSIPGTEVAEAQDTPVGGHQRWRRCKTLGQFLATLSFSPDESVAGTSIMPVQNDYKAHQELLWRMARSLGLQVEEIAKSAPVLVDILTRFGPARMASE